MIGHIPILHAVRRPVGECSGISIEIRLETVALSPSSQTPVTAPMVPGLSQTHVRTVPIRGGLAD